RDSFGQRVAEAFGETYGFVVPRDIDRYLAADWNGLVAAGFLGLMFVGFLVHRKQPAFRMLAVTALGTPIVFLLLGAFSASAGRYLIGMLPAAVLLAASGVAALLARPGARRVLAGAALAVFFGGLSLQALDMLATERKYDWR